MYESKEHWKILKEISRLFKKPLKYNKIEDIWKDINKLKSYKNIKLKDLKEGVKGKFVEDKPKFKKYNPVEFISLEGKRSDNSWGWEVKGKNSWAGKGEYRFWTAEGQRDN